MSEIDKNEQHEEKPFVPKGAMAFFILLLFLLMILWFVPYFTLISRIQ